MEIEYLRALSICLVLGSHVILLSPFIYTYMTPMFQHFSLGVGVDLFFCISGYVVSKSYFDQFDKHCRERQFWTVVKAFWLRRAYRLIPSAWLWVILGCFLSKFFNQSGIFLDLEQNLKSALSIATLTANIAHMYGYLAPNNVYWSLSLEEQFYILYPLLFLLPAQKWRIGLLIIVITVQFPLSRNAFGSISEQYLASFRIDGFAWGILVYIFSRSNFYRAMQPRKLFERRFIALAISFLLICLLVSIPSKLSNLSANMGMLAFATAIIVWLASYKENYTFGGFVPAQIASWLGSRSYGIYLVHLPAFKLTHEISTRTLNKLNIPYDVSATPYIILFAFSLVFILAEINFRYIEEPLRRKGAAKAKQMLNALAASHSQRHQYHSLSE